jgi:hypothetical protein
MSTASPSAVLELKNSRVTIGDGIRQMPVEPDADVP